MFCDSCLRKMNHMKIILMKICDMITVGPYYSLIAILWLYDCLVKSNLRWAIRPYEIFPYRSYYCTYPASISGFIMLFWGILQVIAQNSFMAIFDFFYIIVATR